MQNENLIKNITSKDIKLSKETIKNIIKNKDLSAFKELCEKADFIFPFLKERINKDFVNLINKEDLNVIFEFSKIYCVDFEEIIVNSWLKFANEDLTDEILNLFENGTVEQKAYCAKYFSYIQDPLALELLNKNAINEFEGLKTNCAIALSSFKDEQILNKMKEIVLNSKDDFEKMDAFEFIISYNGDEQVKFVLENCFDNPFLSNIISDVMDNYDFNYLKNILPKEILARILNAIIEELPENITLDSVYYWNLIEFLKYFSKEKEQYYQNILLLAKIKFSEFEGNDIYSFDFDKNIKSEIKNISEYLNSLDLSFDNIEAELKNKDYKFDLALEIIKEYKLSYNKLLAQRFCDDIAYEKKAKIAQVLSCFNQTNLISKEEIAKIKDENIKALIESYLN